MLRDLDDSGREPTDDDIRALAAYAGWGGAQKAFEEDGDDPAWSEINTRLSELLTDAEYADARSSTLTAFYTPRPVVDAMWQALGKAGFGQDPKHPDMVLEPGCGTGNFIRSTPAGSSYGFTGIEADPISAGIARHLCADDDIINNRMERTGLPTDAFDLAVGNVPYSDAIRIDGTVIHDWFIQHSLDAVRPGVPLRDIDRAARRVIEVQGLGQAAEGGLVKGGKVTYLTQNYAKKLDATYTTSLNGNELTVPAGATAQVTVTLQLTDAQKAYYDERFPNGAYVEGFVQLTSKDAVTLSVPFLAFYGDFGAAPVAETGSYATLLGGERSYNTADQVVSGIYSYRSISDSDVLSWMTEKSWLGDTAAPGMSMVPMDEYKFATMFGAYKGFVPETAGVSPNGDNSLDAFYLQIGLLRNVDNIHYTVTNLTTGEVLSEQDTEFLQKSYAGGVYAGSDAGDFDMSWFYAKGVNEDGEEYIDYSKCSQPENSLISVKAEITPECKTAKTQTLEYMFYIDTTGPNSKKPTFSYKTEDWGWGPESMYTISVESNEAWYQDYDMSITIEYDEETGEFFASAFTSTYFPTAQPNGEGVHGMSESGSMMYTDSRTDIFLGYDYAGNCSAYTITGSQLDDNISLSAETDSIYIGEEVTIQNTDVDDYAMLLNWEVSDPEIAEIVSSDNSSVTIKGLKRGDVAVTASVGDFKKSVTIHVLDKNYEDLKGKFQDISGHWAEETILEAVYRGLFNGVSSDLFDPDSAITRAMFVTVLYRMDGQPAVDQKAGFTDVAEGSYYAAAVDWAAKNGIVNGVSETSFDPDAPITREQMAAILYRYAAYWELDVSAEADLSAYEDASFVSAYAQAAMQCATSAGLGR